MNELTVSKSSSEGKGIPEGAEILSKDTRVSSRKIENGYIVSKSMDVRYKLPDGEHTEYAYINKEYYSKEDPFEFNEKSLADKFEDD